MTKSIAIIGLGYVGLPLAVAFGRHQATIGFDINRKRIEELRKGIDTTREVEPDEFKLCTKLRLVHDIREVAEADTFIVTVPTPVDHAKQPDLKPLVSATEMIGAVLKTGDLVIYESTVFPGCTEEICVPVLEKKSGLVYNRDFFCGYSPERINPGDKLHRLETIKKVVSGSTPETAERVKALYDTIITAGTYLAPDLKTAEAAKVIENTQRDINIAFVNELAIIFEKLGIDTHEVLKASRTKWNFLNFQPGLVGGHCIGVDPYYLTHKAETVGYHPEVILSGRRINDGMGPFVASRVIKLMIQRGQKIQASKVLVLGITFKENCPDIRNTKVVNLIHELQEFGCMTHVFDPVASAEEVQKEYGIEMIRELEGIYQAVILAVPHGCFREIDPRTLVAGDGVVFDIKAFFPRDQVTARL